MSSSCPDATRRGSSRRRVAIPHESAALHVTGEALYTDDLVRADEGRAARLAGPGRARPCPDHRAPDTQPALDVPGVVRVLTAADVPGVNDAGVKHDEPLFPDEVMFHGHAVCWVLGRDAGGRPARGARRRGRRTSRCPRS